MFNEGNVLKKHAFGLEGGGSRLGLLKLLSVEVPSRRCQYMLGRGSYLILVKIIYFH